MRDDVDFLGLRAGESPGEYEFTVAGHLARLDGKLYGGTAIAASVAAAELLTDRTALWMTTQFVASAPHLAEVSMLAEVLAEGRRTNQVRVTATTEGGQVVFASLGATGMHRDDGLDADFERAPKVTPPEDSTPWKGIFTGLEPFLPEGVEIPFPADGGSENVMEIRGPEILAHPDPMPGRVCLWTRRVDRRPITPAVAAYIADMVPFSVAYAFESFSGGTSLDNTIRLGSFTETEWILLDLRPHMAVGGYCHGLVHVWSQDGRLLATAGQTASMLHFFGGPQGT
jgi:acyl-CoA thioesterase